MPLVFLTQCSLDDDPLVAFARLDKLLPYLMLLDNDKEKVRCSVNKTITLLIGYVILTDIEINYLTELNFVIDT